MLDFKELDRNGTDFELMTRELLFGKGYHVAWSGEGPDGGKDLICEEEIRSDFAPFKRRWLVQCKHNAHSGKAVGLLDLGNIVEACVQHKTNGYLLVCSTRPSSSLVERLEQIHNNEAFPISTAFWDSAKLERELLSTEHFKIANRYMPVSSGANNWKIYHTEWPNRWIATYKGYYFHLSKRIGSTNEIFFESMESLIADIEKIQLSDGHQIRIRSAYYDDKNGNYTCYLDYMYPHDDKPDYDLGSVKHYLGDGSTRDDFQVYFFDIVPVAYFPHSDHHDFDHYDYYVPYASEYNSGLERKVDYQRVIDKFPEWLTDELDKENSIIRNKSFNNFVKQIKRVPGISVRREVNCNIEDLDIFNKRYNWSQLLNDLDIKFDRFFSAQLFIYVTDFDNIRELLETFPQNVEEHFRLTQVHCFVPNNDMTTAEYSPEEVGAFYELKIEIHPALISNKYDARKRLNSYFDILAERIESFLSKK